MVKLLRAVLAALTLLALVACGSSGVALPTADATPLPASPSASTALPMVNATATGAAPTPPADITPTIISTPAATAVSAAAAPTSAPAPLELAAFEPAKPPDSSVPSDNSPAPALGSADGDATAFGPSGETAQVTTNIQLVFDSSGSMAERIGAETKIAAARAAMSRVITQLPADSATLNVGFRVFGHRGDNSEAGRAESCQSTELLVPMQGVNAELLRAQTNAWQPTGWTPISLALQKAGEDMAAGERVQNVIVMVTDGEETCGGDPCAVSQALAQSEAQVRIDLVGFGLTPDVAKTLNCVAANSGGSYSDAQDGEALARTLEELVGASLKRGVLRIQAVDPGGQPIEVYLPRLLNDHGEIIFDDSDADTGGYRTNYVSGTQRIDLEPGDYRFTVSTGRDQQSEQLAYQDQTTYTATVVAGRETVATVGFGSVTFVNAGMDASAVDGLGLQKWIDGEWRKTLYNSNMSFESGSFRFDEAITLAPGSYRVRDVERDRVLVDNIVVRAGDELRVEVGARRSTLRMQAIGPDGQPVEVYVPTIWNESGKVVTQVEDADSGEARDSTFKGTQRVDLKPGTYRFRVSLSTAASKQLEQHGYHDEFTYTAVVAENQETHAIIGYGGLTLVDAGLPAAARGAIMIEKAVGKNWRDTIFNQELAFDRQYVLAPGRYRIVDNKRDVVLVDDIVIEPGKAVRAELRP